MTARIKDPSPMLDVNDPVGETLICLSLACFACMGGFVYRLDGLMVR